MTITALEALHTVAKMHGIGIIADSIIRNGDAPLSEHEFSSLILEVAKNEKKANESVAQAFARIFDDLSVRKAYSICKGLVDAQPVIIETGRTDTTNDSRAAYEALNA